MPSFVFELHWKKGAGWNTALEFRMALSLVMKPRYLVSESGLRVSIYLFDLLSSESGPFFLYLPVDEDVWELVTLASNSGTCKFIRDKITANQMGPPTQDVCLVLAGRSFQPPAVSQTRPLEI